MASLAASLRHEQGLSKDVVSASQHSDGEFESMSDGQGEAPTVMGREPPSDPLLYTGDLLCAGEQEEVQSPDPPRRAIAYEDASLPDEGGAFNGPRTAPTKMKKNMQRQTPRSLTYEEIVLRGTAIQADLPCASLKRKSRTQPVTAANPTRMGTKGQPSTQPCSTRTRRKTALLASQGLELARMAGAEDLTDDSTYDSTGSDSGQ